MPFYLILQISEWTNVIRGSVVLESNICMTMFTSESRSIGRTHLQRQADPVLYEIFVKKKSTALSDEGENACLIHVVVI